MASARYLDPSDLSPDTLAKYKTEWRDFHNLRALVEIEIEKGKDGYDDKNVVVRAITRDMPAWGNRPPIKPNGGRRFHEGAGRRQRRQRRRSRSRRGPTDARKSVRRDLGRSRQMDEAGVRRLHRRGQGADRERRAGSPDIPIGSLTSNEKGWFFFDRRLDLGEDPKRTASAEGWNFERACHATGFEPDP